MKNKTLLIISLFILFLITACTAGANNMLNTANPAGEIAGFWLGLWHGLIIIITFVISLFNDNVTTYEIHNNGGWYNFGFILGIMIAIGGSGKGTCKSKKSHKEKEWEEIGQKVEDKVRTGIKSWLDESEHKDKDWEEIGQKVEDKIKRELRKWSEK